ncbi:UNVERIFIED_CONTAM: hypothetical protein Sindi_1468400 [Sesamum indicum]
MCPLRSQIPQEHQLFWFQKLKILYWWDYGDESMFKLVKSQAEKFLRKRFIDAWNQLAEESSASSWSSCRA